ncbi:hypothetical protein FJTKL_14502 [Diaporthe vaccinii]|uniref:Serum paraoxonase/arylesterase n=1 Tax=Diaporthe vaccinii TaxID=105482 RepID=A0ABR4E7J2_9PEZI
MANLARVGLGIAVLGAVLSQVPITRSIWTLLSLGLAIGKFLQPISDFPSYQCRRIHDPLLQACEDMWLSEATRQLFLACSDSEARNRWMPSETKLDLAGRSTRDAIIVMDLETLDFKSTSMAGFSGTAGDGTINFAGFVGVELDDGASEFFITNFRPSVDRNGEIVPAQAAVGGNATIEVFRLLPNIDSLQHIRTVADPAIATPNRVAVAGGKGFYLTNDHGQNRIGWKNTLSPILLTGDVTFCPDEPFSPCRVVSEGYGYPNGLIRSLVDGLIYVPESAQGGITVLRPTADNSLEVIDKIHLPYAIDNLSEDQDGTLWAAILPRGIEIMKQAANPHHYFPSSSVFRLSRDKGGKFITEKVLEDSDGSVLPGTTTVVHDARTRKLFLGGAFSPFITICDATK